MLFYPSNHKVPLTDYYFSYSLNRWKMGHRIVSTETFPEKPESGIPKRKKKQRENK